VPKDRGSGDLIKVTVKAIALTDLGWKVPDLNLKVPPAITAIGSPSYPKRCRAGCSSLS